MPTFKTTAFEQPVHSICMPLIVGRAGQVEFASGTAFLIGAGWALTAYHVIEDFVERFSPPLPHSGSHEVGFEVLAYLTLAGGRTLPIKVLHAWRAAPLDLAVLALGIPTDWPEDHRWSIPAVSLLPPSRGTHLVGFGFARSSVTRRADGAIEFDADPSTTTGEVTELHHDIRDRARLPFPCFRTNARFDGGMSGGPVFSQKSGKICGVICSSLPATTDDEEHVSYASSLWPVLMTPIHKPGENPRDQFPLRRLFENGTLHADDLGSTTIEEEASGIYTVTVNYDSMIWDRGEPAA